MGRPGSLAGPAAPGTFRPMKRFLPAICLVAVLASPLSTARADDFADAVQALDAGSYDEKILAVDRLAGLEDDRAIPILAAMLDGRLFVREEDGLLVTGEEKGRREYRLTGALDGQDHGLAASRELEKVRVNNRVRGIIMSALGRLQLGSPDPAMRLAAVDDVLREPSPEAAE